MSAHADLIFCLSAVFKNMRPTLFGTVTIYNDNHVSGMIHPDEEKAPLIRFDKSGAYILAPGETEPYFSGPSRPAFQLKKGDRVAYKRTIRGREFVADKYATEESYRAIEAKITIYRVYHKGGTMEGSLSQIEKANLLDVTGFSVRKNGRFVRCKDPRRPKVCDTRVEEKPVETPKQAAQFYLVIRKELDNNGEIKEEKFAGSLEEMVERFPDGRLDPSEIVEVEFSVLQSTEWIPCEDPRSKLIAA